jgi:hypothetical protein
VEVTSAGQHGESVGWRSGLGRSGCCTLLLQSLVWKMVRAVYEVSCVAASPQFWSLAGVLA